MVLVKPHTKIKNAITKGTKIIRLPFTGRINFSKLYTGLVVASQKARLS